MTVVCICTVCSGFKYRVADTHAPLRMLVCMCACARALASVDDRSPMTWRKGARAVRMRRAARRKAHSVGAHPSQLANNHAHHNEYSISSHFSNSTKSG